MTALATLPTRRPGRKRRPVPVTLPDWQGPTPERLRHAERAGFDIVPEDITTPSGQKIGERRRKLRSLEQLWKAGVLDTDQFAAACRYQRDANLAAVAGPGGCVRYEPRTVQGGSGRDLLPIEAAADYLARLAAAQAVCGPKRRLMLDWIAAEPCGWREQARSWFPQASEIWARASFKRLLRATCALLEVHYKRRP